MQISLTEYTNSDNGELLALTKKHHMHVKSLDVLHRIKNLPGYAEISLRDILENIKRY